MRTRHKNIAQIRATLEDAAHVIEHDRLPDPFELRDAAHAMEEIVGGMWTELEKARDGLWHLRAIMRTFEFDTRKTDRLIADADYELNANEPAPLYQAAPDLLAALETIGPFVEEDYYPNCTTPEFDAAVKQMRAAILKAKGERE